MLQLQFPELPVCSSVDVLYILLLVCASRFGIGRFTTEEEVDYTVERTVLEVKRLREMSPLWEMFQEGVDIKSIQWTQH